MKKGKSNFFLIAPFALWGCISVWTSNLVRLTDKSAVPYAWASLFFSYGIVAVHYIQVAVWQYPPKAVTMPKTKKLHGFSLGFQLCS